MKGRILWAVAVGIAFLGCEPVPGTEELVRGMAVQTNYNKDADFSAFSTYAMPLDTIGKIYNVDPTDTLITGDYGKLISRQVKANLDKAGYTWVEGSQNPDFGVNVFVVQDYDVFQTVNYNGPFYGYPGYYYPGYYGYGGYYGYPYITTYSTNTATLVMEIVDLKHRDELNNVHVVWTAYIGDLITSVDTYGKSKEAIDQAFVQSPYFTKSTK